MCGIVVIACLVVLINLNSGVRKTSPYARCIKPRPGGQSTQLGQTFHATINIERYSTPEERQVLVDAFQQAGSEGLVNALEKMNSKGRIAITGTLGYDTSFIRKIPNVYGYKIRVLTNRPDPIWRSLGEWAFDGLQSLGS